MSRETDRLIRLTSILLHMFENIPDANEVREDRMLDDPDIIDTTMKEVE